MIILLGASASGKTEAAKYLASHYGIQKAITHTTRAPRIGERNGVDYHFVSEEEFSKLQSENGFVETTFYNGHHYGTSKAEVKDDRCVVVDPKGLASFQTLRDPRIVSFLLVAEEKTRRARMSSRKDAPADIEKRIENDRTSFADEKVSSADFVIHTDEKTIPEVASEIARLYGERLKGL